MKLEVIAATLADVVAAAASGADRIELVTSMAETGLTPSLGLIEAAVQSAAIPVNVMVRPHGRDFCYDRFDRETMIADIRHIKRTGAAGIVIGALTSEGKIDKETVAVLLEEADHLDVTFHRAFDEVEDQLEALHELAEFPQISRILTAGGPKPAPQAAESLRKLVKESASSHLQIMAGYGLTPETVEELINATGVTEVHFGSGVRSGRSFHQPIEPTKVKTVKEILNRYKNI